MDWEKEVTEGEMHRLEGFFNQAKDTQRLGTIQENWTNQT